MTKIKKLTCLAVLLAFTSLLIVGCGGAAKTDTKKDAFPTMNINGVIQWGAGGGLDGVSRVISPLAEKTLGKSLILSNKTGASGAIATQYVMDQKADGYTLLYSAENPQLYQVLGLSKLSYDDFEPIILMAQGSTVIVVPKDSPFKTYDDLVKAAKANPGKVTIGNSGVGGQPWVTSAILKKVEGIEFNHVAFDGDGPLITALLGKQIEATGLAIGAAAQYVKNGDVRALAYMSSKKSSSLPEVPLITELNPKFANIMKASGFFYGVWVKKGTPQEAIDKLTTVYKTAFNDPKFQEYCAKGGFTPMGLTGKEAKDFAKEWQKQMAWLMADSGAAKESPEKFGIPKPTN